MQRYITLMQVPVRVGERAMEGREMWSFDVIESSLGASVHVDPSPLPNTTTIATNASSGWHVVKGREKDHVLAVHGLAYAQM